MPRSVLPWLAACVLLAGLLPGCADGGGGSTADASATLDGGQDASAADLAAPDAAPDAALAECFDRWADNESWALDPTGDDGQIHPQVAFQPGRGLWLVYNVPHPGRGDFDVWAARLGCTAADDVAPFLVDDAPDGNAVDPSVAVVGDRALVVWQSEISDRTPNLWLRARLLGADGAPLGPSARIVTEDAPDGVHWMSALAADGTDFILAGVRAGPVANTFTIFAQRLDRDGAPAGPLGVDERPTGGQVEPTVGVTPAGEVRVAWLDDGQTGPTVRAVLGEAGLTPTPAVPLGEPVTAKIRYDRAGAWLVAAANRGGLDVGLWRGDVDAEASPQWFGENGDCTSPGVASDGDGAGVVAWFRLDRGAQSTPQWQAFDPLGVPQGAARSVPTDAPAAPYPMALAHVGGGRYFMAWTEGTSPAFRMVGRFVRP